MKLSEFLKKTSSILQDQNISLIIFQGASYSHTFFSQLFDKLSAQISCDIKMLDTQLQDAHVKLQLSTSFLGLRCIYVLLHLIDMKSKQKDDMLAFLMNYQGPHTVIVFVDDKTVIKENNNTVIINLQEKYTFQDAKLLFFDQDLHKIQKMIYFLQQIYKINTSYSLDELYILKNYQELLSSDIHASEFYQTWVPRIINIDISLFTLSQLFFEKKEKEFFSLWLKINMIYSEMFWISYWSEQIYRAYFFIKYTQLKNYTAAKQVSFGLPFSFLKQSYKKYTLSELQQVHEALYEIDIALKNGGNSYKIDQLYIKFFNYRS